MARAQPAIVGAIAASLLGCQPDAVVPVGQFGARIPLATGDGSELPRLMFIDEGCPGSEAIGGCPGSGQGRSCVPILVDSLAPLTAVSRPDSGEQPVFSRECIEVRAAAGMAAETPTEEAREAAVTRFRFRDVPLVRASADGTEGWTWLAGDEDDMVDPYAVLGGNVLSKLAVAFRTPVDGNGQPSITFYTEFPGTEDDLAEQGLAFLPLQFPGRLLGRDLNDRCDIAGEPCDLGGFDLQGRVPSAISATRMVMDACVAMPPCGIHYQVPPERPFSVGSCAETIGPDAPVACTRANDPEMGGRPGSLVVATGVPGLVLFSDSTERMFGDLDTLPSCEAVEPATPACIVDREGTLFVSGWPPAGNVEAGELPLVRLRVRSVALVPGLTRTRGDGPCTRAQARLDALEAQCGEFVEAFSALGNIEDTTPPYAADNGSSETSLAVLGEARLAPGTEQPDPQRWIETLVLPADHPLVLSLRRDVAPAAIQPDGLIGSALFADTLTVLDYTDQNPALRVACLDPSSGDCLVAPECGEDADPACCYGLPRNLLADFIVLGDDDTCCRALSAQELAEIQALGFCPGVSAT